ncbi:MULTISPECIES: hypothetical protein [unclassified Lentilitoribacter]|jgi:hypothetical protein|uniref:hypothetical protein n=1 Tax=unclassified Lentilitoribacter TaxID=2647570 RepID=UPI0013A7073F|nr:hypothetical protein [Lentilitoribacter sp. Alg239-R112]
MRTPAKQTFSIVFRVSLLMAVLTGPLCAMALSQDRGFGDDSNAIGFVLIKSIQRGA